jgi:hypothetical protein
MYCSCTGCWSQGEVAATGLAAKLTHRDFHLLRRQLLPARSTKGDLIPSST